MHIVTGAVYTRVLGKLITCVRTLRWSNIPLIGRFLVIIKFLINSPDTALSMRLIDSYAEKLSLCCVKQSIGRISIPPPSETRSYSRVTEHSPVKCNFVFIVFNFFFFFNSTCGLICISVNTRIFKQRKQQCCY